MIQLFRWLIHPVARYIAIVILKRTSSLYTYPILIEITFNKEKYARQYINGKSYITIFYNLSTEIYKRVTRTQYKTDRRKKMGEEDPDHYKKILLRYARVSQYYNDKREAEIEEEQFLEAEQAYNAL